MSNWGSQGWDSLDDFGPEKTIETGPRKFYMPANVTKRILFLGNAPFTFWEHSLWEITRSGKDREVCLKKNRIANECPLCDKEMWPSYIGYFTVVDMGDVKRSPDGTIRLEGWTSDKGVTYQFGRKLLGAKRGGRDKPGILKKISRMTERHGDLYGSVYDVYRSGNKVESCGDEWNFVERVDPDNFRDYLIANGATAEQVSDLSEVNYSEQFVPKTVDDLKAIVNGGSTSDFGGGFGVSDSASQGGNPWQKW